MACRDIVRTCLARVDFLDEDEDGKAREVDVKYGRKHGWDGIRMHTWRLLLELGRGLVSP